MNDQHRGLRFSRARSHVGLLSRLFVLLLAVLADHGIEPIFAQRTSAGKAANEIGDNDNDLFARIRDCEVLTVTGDDFGAVFTVSGQVSTADDKLVEGAIVVLRESSTHRLSDEPDKYLYGMPRHRLRVPDVFARTTTDSDGKFEFREVKSPAPAKRRSEYWEGGLVAAHEDLGVGWLSLAGSIEKQHASRDLTVVLRPPRSISGRFVTPDGAPIPAATVNIHYLGKHSRYPGPLDQLDIQMSQLAPRARTDADGLFTFRGLPESFAAFLWAHHPDWYGGNAVIATSEDVQLGIQTTDGGRLRNQNVQASPGKIIADPFLYIEGKVIDAEGEAIPNVTVSLSPTIIRQQTDGHGRFRLAVSSKSLTTGSNGKAAPTIARLYAYAPPALGFLPKHLEVPTEELLANQPVTIELETGVKVRGSVVSDDGHQLPEMSVHAPTARSHAGGTVASDGSFEIVLPKGEYMLLAASDERGYEVPTLSDLRRATPKSAGNWPHQLVDLADGRAQKIPPIVVSRLTTLQLIATLPDGHPAIGATAIIKDLEESRSPTASLVVAPRTVNKSYAVITDDIGRAELSCSGMPSEKAYVQVTLRTDEQAFDASVPLSSAVDNVLRVVLSPGWVVEGRVLIEGKPVAGAVVSISQLTLQRRTANGRTVLFSTASNQQQAVTDKHGWYRQAVSEGKTYSVSLLSLPNERVLMGTAYRPVSAGEGRMRVSDFDFLRGDQEIAGRVIDTHGKPIPGAYVQVKRQNGLEPGFWLGHRNESQNETDRLGRFHLRRVPAGRYELSVRGPRRDGQRRPPSKSVEADTGTLDLEVVLDAGSLLDIVR